MGKSERNGWLQLRARLFKMVSVGVIDEPINQGYDVISTGALIANLVVSVMATFDNLNAAYGSIFLLVEQLTVFFFGIDYVLRILTAPELYPGKSSGEAVAKYCFSLSGIIDLLSFLPYYLPVFFPAGVAAFRMFRVVRILRLFRINAYYDSLNVITEVLVSKKQQLLSSVFIIATLMLGSSLCMYSLEHEAQPEVFSNAFSGIWWSASTLLTVGYGDIYPVTPIGKFFGICITFLGVGLTSKDAWTGKALRDIALPADLIIAIIIRGRESVVPKEDVVLQSGDKLVIGAEPIPGEDPVEIRELEIGEHHKWNGFEIRELDISRQSYIVMVKRGGEILAPSGSLIIRAGDNVYMYTKKHRELA